MTARVVFDTNVLLSALVFRQGRLSWLRLAWQQGHVTPILCRTTMDELLRVLAYPKFQLAREQMMDLLEDLLPFAEVVEQPDGATESPRCPDPDDQVFLDLAVSANADALVTGDHDLLDLTAHSALTICTPNALRESLPTV